MNGKKNNRILWLFFVLLGTSLPAAEKTILLREGLELRQVEGTARIHERTRAWRFVTRKALKDGEITIPAETELTILPGSGLEKIIAYAGKGSSVIVRIDAIVTQYRNTNFLYIFDATPLKQITPEAASSPQEKSSQPTAEPAQKENQTAHLLQAAADPNAPSIIPPDILERMKPRQKTDFARMEEITREIDIVEDRMLVNRTGRFVLQDSRTLFMLDGFGQNISGRSFALLPCQTLQQTEDQMRRAFGRQRYRVSGIITVFRGKPFLLLQSAVRTYTHGNFTP